MDTGRRMTEQELRTEIRRGLLIIIRALMKRYAMTWLDFIPADDRESMTFSCPQTTYTINTYPPPVDT